MRLDKTLIHSESVPSFWEATQSFRVSEKLSQKAFAQKYSIPLSTIKRWESQKNTPQMRQKVSKLVTNILEHRVKMAQEDSNSHYLNNPADYPDHIDEHELSTYI